MSAGTAAWVDGKLILGTGADNAAYYNKGYADGFSQKLNGISIQYVYHNHNGCTTSYAVAISLIAIFYPEYQYDATKIIVDIGGNMYKSTGTTIRELGYKALFKNHTMDNGNDLQILPELDEGDIISVDSVAILDKKDCSAKKI